MRRGKEIAQGSHASMAFLTKRIAKCLKASNTPYAYMYDHEREWILSSFRKITCQVNTLEELLDLEKKAQEAGLEVNLITDSGLTEFGGMPTVTCLAIGPDYCDKIDIVTGDLKLY